MTANRPTSVDPYEEPLADYDKSAIIVPMIIGGAVIVAVIILWMTQQTKLHMMEMARTEVAVRQELRIAYGEMRTLNPDAARIHAEKAAEHITDLQTGLAPDYAQLKIALLFLEGELDFMQNCTQNAAATEEKFSQALALMSYASGDMWQFGMIGRARARFELRQYDNAIQDLNTLLDRNKSFGTAYYWRALARQELGDTAGAEEDEARARALDSWPPLRDFMQDSCTWTRDILIKQQHRLPANYQDERSILRPGLIPPVDSATFE